MTKAPEKKKGKENSRSFIYQNFKAFLSPEFCTGNYFSWAQQSDERLS